MHTAFLPRIILYIPSVSLCRLCLEDNNACATRAPCLACRTSRGHCLRLQLHVFLVLNFYQTHLSTRSDNGDDITMYILYAHIIIVICGYVRVLLRRYVFIFM